MKHCQIPQKETTMTNMESMVPKIPLITRPVTLTISSHHSSIGTSSMMILSSAACLGKMDQGWEEDLEEAWEEALVAWEAA